MHIDILINRTINSLLALFSDAIMPLTFREAFLPMYYQSKSLCTMAFDFSQNGQFVKCINCTFYIVRAVLFSVTFIIGNFYTETVVRSHFHLEYFVFQVANLMIISFVVFFMLQSPFCQDQVINIYNSIQELDGELSPLHYKELKYVVFGQTLACVVYSLLTFILNYFNDYTLVLQFQYSVFFLIPELVQFTTLFQFSHIVWLIRQKLKALNMIMKKAAAGDIKKIVNIYEHIFRVSKDVQKRYGIILLWILANYFTWITCDLYKFVNTMLQNKTDPSILAVISHYVIIIYTVSICSSAKEEVEQFKLLLISKMNESADLRCSGAVSGLQVVYKTLLSRINTLKMQVAA